MVAGCPKCSARYRVDVEKIGPDGARLRCTKCSAVFLVRAPAAPAPEQPVAPAPVPAPSTPADSGQAEAASSAAVAGPSEGSTPESQEPPEDFDPARLVLIADPDAARGKASADAIRGWGLTPHLVHDGVEAMLCIQRMLPAAVVLDAALPKMFGFQVCEVVKRNESLRSTRVVLVGAIHHQDRYRRDPSELYGADVYIEQPDLPEGLLAILRDAGLPLEPSDAGGEVDPVSGPDTPSTPAAPPPPEPDGLEFSFDEPDPDPEEELVLELDTDIEEPQIDTTPQAEESAPAMDEDPERVEERERAQRLARIAVSEMVLYQPEKFDQASQDGNLEQMLDLEIQEARALLRQRVGEEVRAETDFILDELNRVAAERRGDG